jgi:NADPH:quinone reductase-like Zn-dependent oxidoreductase
MLAAVCTHWGPPEVLQIQDRPTPNPQGTEVRIRIHATAVTSSDCYTRGLSLSPALQLMARVALGWSAPRQPVLGMVLAGEVDAVGPTATSFTVGQPIVGFNHRRFGTYAQFVCWPEEGFLAARPPNLTDDEAAAIPYGGLLAFCRLRAAGVQPGQRVLVYGASGAVGTAAVQLARHLGAEVTGVCSGPNTELAASLGATAVIDYTREDFTKAAARYDLVLDAVGKRKSAKAFMGARDVLSPGGAVVSVDDGRPDIRPADMALLAGLAEQGVLKPVIDRRYPLEDIVEAHRYVDGGHKRGNVIINVP